MGIYEELELQHQQINGQIDQFVAQLNSESGFDPVEIIQQLEEFSKLLFAHFTLEDRVFSQMIIDQNCVAGRKSQILESMGDIQRVISVFVSLIRRWWMKDGSEIDREQFRAEVLENLDTIHDCLQSEESDIFAYCESCIREVDLEERLGYRTA
ncbi:MAG: hemerythrin domain-containing protein [Gammaproteobacteria bacterium]|uniref:Hemerythrin domain-containing protein n=1 Tax=Candidatus Thiopontia autotrophica TaxID=2841688 RepID=A0A8J6TXV4_9GAMM|nr:hemerythrin domain-containing protein [Candidatus Thiopontia autotrophica]MBL6968604.1 hemerythrin domain-containing protein [Gammaproteobacteria bacterium]